MKIVPPFLCSIALIWNLLYNVYHVDGCPKDVLVWKGVLI